LNSAENGCKFVKTLANLFGRCCGRGAVNKKFNLIKRTVKHGWDICFPKCMTTKFEKKG
jgi:hypothetical protein